MNTATAPSMLEDVPFRFFHRVTASIFSLGLPNTLVCCEVGALSDSLITNDGVLPDASFCTKNPCPDCMYSLVPLGALLVTFDDPLYVT